MTLLTKIKYIRVLLILQIKCTLEKSLQLRYYSQTTIYNILLSSGIKYLAYKVSYVIYL